MKGARGVVTALLALSVSCAGTPDGARPTTVVLFDVSRSTVAMRQEYRAAFTRILDEAERTHGRVIGDVIDDDPLAHATAPIDVAFSTCDAFSTNPLVCQAQADRAKAAALARAGEILARTPLEAGTDIHDAVLLARRALGGPGDRSLVLLSDMVERSPSLNVLRLDDPAAALTALGEVPDLTGVRVYVVGAGVVSGGELPAERILSIQSFWESYFAEAGADLAPERYGPSLLSFP